MDLFNRFLHNPFLFDSGDGGGGGDNPPAVKTYNQDELNGIVGSRIAEERQKIYDLVGVKNNQELTERFGALTTLEQENATLKEQVGTYEQKFARVEKEGKLVNAGIDPDFIDLALTRWDGEQDLEEFVKENPKLTVQYFEQGNFQGTGGSLDEKGGKKEVDFSKMTTEEFMEYHRKLEQPK